MEASPGDLIEIFRPHVLLSLSYQHWAVYVGDGYVVHMVNLSPISSPSLSSAFSPPTSSSPSSPSSPSISCSPSISSSPSISCSPSSPSTSSSSQTKKGKVKKQRLEDVAGRNMWRVNNKFDKIRKPRPAEEIVREALSLVGEDKVYHLINFNCEHFATKLRYGVSTSWQVIKYTLTACAGVLGGALTSIIGPGGTLTGAFSAACYTKKLLDKLD